MGRRVNKLKNEIKRVVIRPLYRRVMGKPPLGNTEYDARIPIRAAKRILTRHGLGYQPDGNPSWWYQAFDGRNSADELTHFEFNWIRDNVPSDGRILVTGCGVGLTTIWMKQQGFRTVEGLDYLPHVVASAKEVATLAGEDIPYWQEDGFSPNIESMYDCITAMHWVYSAWMGNYDNPVEQRTDGEEVLVDFLKEYVNAMKPGGVMLLELVDGLLDYAIPPFSAYPVRQTVEQVRHAADRTGLTVERVVSNPFGNRPIVVLYVLRRPV